MRLGKGLLWLHKALIMLWSMLKVNLFEDNRPAHAEYHNLIELQKRKEKERSGKGHSLGVTARFLVQTTFVTRHCCLDWAPILGSVHMITDALFYVRRRLMEERNPGRWCR